MAIADDIGLQMAQQAGQAPQMQIGSAAASGAATGMAFKQGFQAQNQEEAANQFQQVLNQGYQGMVQAFKSLAPEEQQMVGDPGLYQRSEDTMAAWWGMVAKAQKQTEQKAALATGTQQIMAGEKLAGNATLMKSGNLPPEQGIKNIEAANLETKVKDQGKAITDALSEPVPAPANRYTRNAFAKRFMDTLGLIESNDKDIGAHPRAANGLQAFGRLGVVPELHAQRVGLDPTNQKDLEKFKSDPELQYQAAENFVMELGKKYNWDPGMMRRGYYGITKDPSAPQKLADGRIMPSSDEDHDKFMQAFGDAQTVKDAEARHTRMTDMVMKLAKKDPELPNHPLAKTLLEAMEKDARYAKEKRESNINAMRERNIQLKEKNALQTRVNATNKLVADKLDLWDDFKNLDKTMPGGLYGRADVPGTGLGSKLWRDWLISKEAGAFRSALAALKNQKIRIASGQTVTKDEMNRMEKQLGLTGTDSAEVFRMAIQREYEKARDDYERDMRVDPEAALELMNRSDKLKDVFSLKRSEGGSFKTKTGKSIKVTVTKK